jgi:hypothetical protein
VLVQASILPMPVPADQLEPCYPGSWLWPNAEAELRQHAMMLTVTGEGGDAVVDRMVSMTMVLAAVIGTCPQAAGVLWDGADHLVKGDVFRDFAVQQLPGHLPLILWVGCPAHKNADGTSRGCTVGMGQFALPDIETSDAPLSVRDLRQRLASVANHLVTKSANIPDGATIIQAPDHTVTVSYGPSKFGRPGRVMRLRHHRKGAPE